MKCAISVVGVVMIALCLTQQANAATSRRVPVQTAVNNCQASLPTFEGAFRKRPLGIGNEGNSVAFLSCSIATEFINSTGIEEVLLTVTNRSLAPGDVFCTLVDGTGQLELPPFTSRSLPKSISVPPGQKTFLAWSRGEFGGAAFSLPNLSCAIPPGFELNDTQTIFHVDIGTQ